MNCSKEFFLGCLGGVRDYPHNVLLTNDLTLYHENDREPFGELVTKNGQTILHIGYVESNGIKVIV